MAYDENVLELKKYFCNFWYSLFHTACTSSMRN